MNIPGTAGPDAPTGGGPTLIFEDRFPARDGNDRPCNWKIQKHSSLAHNHGRVVDRGFELYTSGARYVPILPPVTDFSMEVEWRVATPYSGEVSLLGIFSYDAVRRRGRCLRLVWLEEGLKATLGTLAGREFLACAEFTDGKIPANLSKPRPAKSSRGLATRQSLPRMAR